MRVSCVLMLILVAAYFGSTRAADSDTASEGLPLKATRSVRFEVHEGTWISLDISPDGKTALFDLLGQLYVVPMTGGTARAITRGLAWNGQPRYSPDGSRIVFTSDRDGEENLWISRSDGSDARKITHSVWSNGVYVSPAWSPGGTVVVATKITGPRFYEPMNLVAIEVSSGRETRLTNVNGADSALYSGAAFGSSFDYVYSARSARSRSGYSNDWQIVRVSLDPSHPTSHNSVGVQFDTDESSLQSNFAPELSRDGQFLAYARETGGQTAIILRDLRSGTERTLVPKAQRHAASVLQSRGLMPGMAFTPDSRALVFTYGGGIHRVDLATGHDAMVPFTANVDQPLGPLVRNDFPIQDDRVQIRGIQHPELSPDAKHLAFSAVDHIWVMDFPNGTPRRLTKATTGEFNPTWSLDGRWIAYTTWSDLEGGAAYRVEERRGGRLQRLTTDNYRYEFAHFGQSDDEVWATRVSAQPSALLYRLSDWDYLDTTHRPERELVRISAEEGTVSPVARLGKMAEAFQGSPFVPEAYPDQSGFEWIYTRDLGLLRVPRDGRDPVTIARIYGPAFRGSGTPYGAGHLGIPATNVVPSPDGKMLIVRIFGGSLFLIELGERLPNDLSIGVMDTPPLGVHVQRIGSEGGDFVGWGPDGSYLYYASGNMITMRRVVKGESQSVTLTPEKHFEIPLDLQADKPTGSLALRGARLVTMREHEVIEKGDIVVRGNRILAIGKSGTVTIPADAMIQDVAGSTIIPGYVDIHDHVRATGPIHSDRFPYFLGELAYGVTTSRDPLGFQDLVTYGERIAIGEMVGPRVFGTNEGIAEQNLIGLDSFEDVRGYFARWAEDYQSETMKLIFVGGRRKRELAAMAARANGLYPTNHIEGDANMMTIPIDGYAGLEHSLVDVPVYEDVAKLFAQSGIVWTPTLGIENGFSLFTRSFNVSDPKFQRFVTPYQRTTLCCQDYVDPSLIGDEVKAPATVVAAGGKVGLGAHGNLTGLGDHWELWLMAMGGMPNYDVLRVGTIFSAEGIGHAKDLGSLEIGKLADLQILDKNPLDDIHNTLSIHYVMKNGRLYEASDLTEVWPRQKKLDPLPWWNSGN